MLHSRCLGIVETFQSPDRKGHCSKVTPVHLEFGPVPLSMVSGVLCSRPAKRMGTWNKCQKLYHYPVCPIPQWHPERMCYDSFSLLCPHNVLLPVTILVNRLPFHDTKPSAASTSSKVQPRPIQVMVMAIRGWLFVENNCSHVPMFVWSLGTDLVKPLLQWESDQTGLEGCPSHSEHLHLAGHQLVVRCSPSCQPKMAEWVLLL